MSDRAVALRIERCIGRVGIYINRPIIERLALYLGLLARWNRRINLTGFSVDPPTDDAVDRLIVEPLAAARFVSEIDHLTIDIGSGGGSPAIPLKIARPALRLILVEIKVRKCAFLRECIRELGLGDADVENRRYEELLARADIRRAADLVLSRAVRIDDKMLQAAHALLRPGGRIFLFTSGRANALLTTIPELVASSTEALIPTLGSQLQILVSI